MKKWKYELVGVGLVLCLAGGIWWFHSTKAERKANAEYKQLLRFAQRQAIEIAVIEQASKLENYKQQMAANRAIAQPRVGMDPNLIKE